MNLELLKRNKYHNGALFEQDFLFAYNQKLLDIIISLNLSVCVSKRLNLLDSLSCLHPSVPIVEKSMGLKPYYQLKGLSYPGLSIHFLITDAAAGLMAEEKSFFRVLM